MAEVDVKIDYNAVRGRIAYFYNQMKFIGNDEKLRLDLFRKVGTYAQKSNDLFPIPYLTGALEGSTPGKRDIKKKPYTLENKHGDVIKTNYARGYVDLEGLHWAPFTYWRGSEFHYAEMPNVKWDAAERMETNHTIERVFINELFGGKNGLKKSFPMGVAKKNRYILHLGD